MASREVVQYRSPLRTGFAIFSVAFLVLYLIWSLLPLFIMFVSSIKDLLEAFQLPQVGDWGNALPTFFEQVKPTRMPVASPSPLLRACNRKAGAPWRPARAARRKSARTFRRDTAGPQTDTAGGVSPGLAEPGEGASGGVMSGCAGARNSGAQRLPATRAAGVEDLAARLRRHARTESVAPLADQIRRLICAFHCGSLQFSGQGTPD